MLENNAYKLKKLNKKGIAGMEIYLSVIVMVFLSGMIIFAFVLGGNKISSQLVEYETLSGTFTNKTTATVVNSSATSQINTVDTSLSNCAITITQARNLSGTVIGAGNYTTSGCLIQATASVTAVYNNTVWNVTGTYTYTAETNASVTERQIIADTTSDVGEARTFFGVFITIAGLVVVILLVLLLVRATKSEGITNGA